MATSLRDIPGAHRPKKRRAERGLWTPSRPTTLDLTPGALRLGRRRSRGGGFVKPPNQVDLFLWLLIIGALAVVAWLGHAFWSATRVQVEVAGVDSGRALTPEHAADLDISITLASTDELFRSTLTIDGIDVLEDLRPTDDTSTTIAVKPAALVQSELVSHALDEGEHKIHLSVGRLLLGDSQFTWRYVVDSVAPTLNLPSSLAPVPIADPVTVRGTLEKGATLTYAGHAVDVDDDEFSIEFGTPPAGALQFVATDEAGNATKAELVVPVIYPETSHAIHVSGAAWANDELHAGVVDLIDRGLIDTVELDLKDESGIVSYDSQLPEARRIGAVSSGYDLAETVRDLDSRGVRVIGRIVAFRDSIYAEAAWAAGRKDEVLQTPAGGMLATTYGGFTNYANADVRQYNLDIALEAVSLGVKDILWDYIRRPEGDPASMVVPGLVGPSSASVTSFLAESQAQLRKRGAFQGASVFGIAAAAGDSIAQDVPAIARVVDYLAPMLYPSHWGPGMYRVDSPIHQPGEIVDRSLADFQRVTAGSGVRLLPWLQAFTLYGVPYGPTEIRAQIDAAKALGVDGFLLWNPNVRYAADALDPIKA